MLDDDGRPSESGYRFVDLCERTKDCFSGRAFTAFGTAILKAGQLASFLHYVHRISEEKFASDPLFCCSTTVDGEIKFNQTTYLKHLQSMMTDELCVMNSSSIRGGTRRRPFQAELAILAKLGIVYPREKRYRMSCGLIINWPKLSEYLDS